MKNRIGCFVCATLLMLIMCVSAAAQDQPTIYTRVAQWRVARTQWEPYEKDFTKNTKPIFDKLLSSGVITEWGADSVTIHSVDGYSHSTWFAATSLASLERALEALQEADKKLSPEERKKQDTDFVGDKHADFLFRSVLYHSRATKADSGYTWVSTATVKPGKGQEYRQLWEKNTKPVYEQLFADGTVTAYGMDTELVHTGDSGLRSTWYIVANAQALDKVQAAFQAATQKRTPEEREAIGRAFGDITVAGTHRDYFSKVNHYSAKY